MTAVVIFISLWNKAPDGVDNEEIYRNAEFLYIFNLKPYLSSPCEAPFKIYPFIITFKYFVFVVFSQLSPLHSPSPPPSTALSVCVPFFLFVGPGTPQPRLP